MSFIGLLPKSPKPASPGNNSGIVFHSTLTILKRRPPDSLHTAGGHQSALKLCKPLSHTTCLALHLDKSQDPHRCLCPKDTYA